MVATGTILALDLGIRTGWAVGAPGTRPESGSITLKKPGSHRSVAFAGLLQFVSEKLSEHKPMLVIIEAMLPLQAFKNLGNAAATVRVTSGLHAIVEALCVYHGIEWRDVHDATVRKHFIGKGRCGTRAETKRAVIARCQLLRYVPLECIDDNRADALAVWDYAVATFGKR